MSCKRIIFIRLRTKLQKEMYHLRLDFMSLINRLVILASSTQWQARINESDFGRTKDMITSYPNKKNCQALLRIKKLFVLEKKSLIPSLQVEDGFLCLLPRIASWAPQRRLKLPAWIFTHQSSSSAPISNRIISRFPALKLVTRESKS